MLKVLILTMDNLPLLAEQLAILREEPLVSGIVVVNNGSLDGTREFLDRQRDLVVVHRENRGPGPGRNAGLDAAGEFEHVLLLDGGVRPLRGGVSRMRDYLDARRDAHAIGVEIADMVTDETQAMRDWPARPIFDNETYRNTVLSHTAYCLARREAFAGIRFCEEGPFGEPGWGVDDNEMAYRWTEAGIAVHVAIGVARPYRRAAGSFQRLFRETGIWPNQYGSVYEKRLVWCQQTWPQYAPGVQRGEPWLTVVLRAGPDVEATAQMVKRAHDRLRERRFAPPAQEAFNPYSIVVQASAGHPFRAWAEPRRLRQHHGDTQVIEGRIVRRGPDNEASWTGDFLAGDRADWRELVRPGARLFARVEDFGGLERLLARYQTLHPRRDVPPGERAEIDF